MNDDRDLAAIVETVRQDMVPYIGSGRVADHISALGWIDPKLRMSCRQLAGLYLANAGVDPITREQVVDAARARRLNALVTSPPGSGYPRRRWRHSGGRPAARRDRPGSINTATCWSDRWPW